MQLYNNAVCVCFAAHQNRVSDMVFSLESQWVVSTGHDKSVSWMCTQSGSMLGRHYFTAWASCLQYPHICLNLFLVKSTVTRQNGDMYNGTPDELYNRDTKQKAFKWFLTNISRTWESLLFLHLQAKTLTLTKYPKTNPTLTTKKSQNIEFINHWFKICKTYKWQIYDKGEIMVKVKSI